MALTRVGTNTGTEACKSCGKCNRSMALRTAPISWNEVLETTWRIADILRRDYNVSIATTEEERRGIYALRYSVYVQEQGKPYPGADRERGLLYDELDEEALTLYTLHNGEVQSTGRFNVLNLEKVSTEFAENFNLRQLSNFLPIHNFFYTSRVVVAGSRRGSKLSGGISMCRALYRCGLENKPSINFISCGEDLVSLYKRIGYFPCGRPFHDRNSGMQQPMVFLLDDLEHLEATQSPLRADYSRKTPNIEPIRAMRHAICNLAF